MNKYLEANIVFSKFIRAYMSLKSDLPIRPSEMGVLNIIVKRDGFFTPVMISELLEVTKPMVANHIAVLERKGYITKKYLTTDKRSFYVIPTSKAIDLVSEEEKKLNNKLFKVENLLGTHEFNELVNTLDEVRKLLGE